MVIMATMKRLYKVFAAICDSLTRFVILNSNGEGTVFNSVLTKTSRSFAGAAIGFIKATKTLRKKPHIALKSLNSIKNVFKKPRNP
jgi:hypothetical protein